MAKWFLAAWCVVVAVAHSAWGATDEVRSLKLTIGTPREKYLLGEPVPLRGALRNVGKEPFTELRADLPIRRHALDIFVSDDGIHFGKELRLLSGEAKVRRRRDTLEPNQEWVFDLSVLYTYSHPTRLAFETAGEHFIKVGYPLLSRGMGQRLVVESNVLPVLVVKPKGDDRKVWDQIDRPEFLRFLESGRAEPSHPEIPRQAFELVRAFPQCGYQEALRHSLREYYEARRGELSADPELPLPPDLDEIRRLLGIPKEPVGPFPNDRRLEVKVTFHFPEQTPMRQVFALISAQAGVPLRQTPDLEIRTMSSVPSTMPLRRFMREMESSDTGWVREDDGGYRLVPVVRPHLLPRTPPRPPKPKPAKPADGKQLIPDDGKPQPEPK
jgi:hypothetical protein